MPGLDRRITVQIAGEGVRNDRGRFVRGEPAEYQVWASVEDLSSLRTLDREGTRFVPMRRWRVRYFEALAAAPTDKIFVIDGDTMFTVTNVVEQERRAERRRFMYIEATGSP